MTTMTTTNLEALQAFERELAELRKARADVLAELDKRPNDDNVHQAIDSYDRTIGLLETKVNRLQFAQSEAGRRARDAALQKAREESLQKLEGAQSGATGPLRDAAAAVDAAVAALRTACTNYVTVGEQVASLAHAGLRPLMDTATTARRRSPADYARPAHGTLNALIDFLGSRDAREMNITEYTHRLTDRLVLEIGRVVHQASHKE